VKRGNTIWKYFLDKSCIEALNTIGFDCTNNYHKRSSQINNNNEDKEDDEDNEDKDNKNKDNDG
jgi:hypothetical protein